MDTETRISIDEFIASAFKFTSGVPTYANDAAAATGGLTAGTLYMDSAGIARIKL